MLYLQDIENVGADIEYARPYQKAIVKSCFTNDEVAYLQDEVYSLRAFYTVWTRKEAYLKYLGCGLRRSLKSFSVFSTDEGYYSSFERSGYVISCFSRRRQISSEKFIFLSFEDLLDQIMQNKR